AEDGCLRVLGSPGEPLDLNAIHPDEPGASVGGAAGDVPMAAGPFVHEWSSVGLTFDFENPACISLDSGRSPGLVVGCSGAGWSVPQDDARLAFGQVMEHARFFHSIDGIGSRAGSVPDAQDRRIGREARVGRAAALE